MKGRLKGAILDSRVKRTLLKNLRKGPTSGEQLSTLLNISRTAVWKHIQELNSLGYSIIGTGRGYRLVKEAEIPYPWELDVESVYFPSVPSTMDIARNLAEKGILRTLIIAEEQTAGRGRLGKEWASPKGGLYFSVAVSPEIPMKELIPFRFEIMEKVAKSLKKLGAMVEVTENGFLTERGKLGGVLVEGFGEPELVKFAVIGVGINVNNPVPMGGTSLSLELNRKVSLLETARAVVEGIPL